MKKILLIITLIFTVTTIITGCNNKKEDIIKGKWKANIENQRKNRENKWVVLDFWGEKDYHYTGESFAL